MYTGNLTGVIKQNTRVRCYVIIYLYTALTAHSIPGAYT